MYQNSTQVSNTVPAYPAHTLYTGRRIWVRRPGGTPTTLIVHQNDIVDDLKSLVINKFPNSLAKLCDPADLIIGMYSPSKSHYTSNSIAGKKTTSQNLSISPEGVKSPITPVNQTTPINSKVILEPDQSVYSILDQYYPNGMSMSDSFLIEISANDHEMVTSVSAPGLIPTHSANMSSNNSNSARASVSTSSYYRNSSSSQLSQMYNTSMNQQASQNQQFAPPQQNYNSGSNQINHPSPQHPGRSTTPVLTISAQSFNSYHQPKPQYLYQNKALSTNNSPGLPKDRSISPSTILTKQSQSPAPGNSTIAHRRSLSNPPQSPVSAASGNGANAQAVLLLPRNFSLASGGGNNNQIKKRYSLDENMVGRSRVNSTASKSPALQATNLSNIGVEVTSPVSGQPVEPFPMLKSRSNPLSLSSEPIKELGESRSNGSDTTITNTTNSNGGANEEERRVYSTPSPPGDSQQLKASSREIREQPHKETGKKEVKEKEKEPKKSGNLIPYGGKGTKHLKSSKSTTDKVLPSISVLVVEDNAINQAILGAFLRKHKIHYQIAKNGQEAIDKWRKGGFHLVLMDIQLPVKSGIEATKEIRHLEKVNRIGVFAQNELGSNLQNPETLKDEEKLDLGIFRSPVIIVALTASSNSSVDKKNALMAGCNDYLTKPVNLVWLQNKITEWGCMQALIDFDGWNSRSLQSGEPDTPTKTHKKHVRKNDKLEKLVLTSKQKPLLTK
ncbi:uncharacterized protein RJT20DRAFT_98637 [Scheffersomyces xylosifermentans]|uniref:uncharacterized protein n=1 Tax=Scheffersomyces xylosifermentans TaxID=1304137 RepID=UPI00315D4CCC